MFFYLLTGRPPFQGGTLAELLLKHQMEPVPDVRQLRPEISADTAAIVTHLLAKRPEERFQSPSDLAQALEPLIQGGDGHAAALAYQARPPANEWSDLTTDNLDRPVVRAGAPASEQTTFGPPPGRRPQATAGGNRQRMLLLVGGGLLAVLLLAIVLIMSLTGDRKPLAGSTAPATPLAVAVATTPANPPRPSPPDPRPIPPDPRPMPPDPRPMPAPAAPAGAAELWQIQSPLTLTKLSISPDGKQALTCTASSNVLFWDLEKRQLAQTVKASFMEVYAVGALTERGKGLVGQPVGIGLLDMGTGQVIKPYRGDAETTCYAMAASADGRRAVVGTGTAARKDCFGRLFDLENGQQLARSDELPTGVTKVSCSADGRRALLQCSNQLYVWDADKGPAVRKLAIAPRDAVLTPDGRQALISVGGIVFVWDVEGDRQVKEIDRFPNISRVAVSPDGKFGLLLREVMRMPQPPLQTLRLVELASGQTVNSVEGIEAQIRDVAFLGDSNRALSIGQDRMLRAWDLTPAGKPPAVAQDPPMPPVNNGEFRSLPWPTAGLRAVFFSPDSRSAIATTSGESVLVYDVQAGKLVREVSLQPKGRLDRVALLSDGLSFVAAPAFGEVGIYSLTTGKRERSLEGPRTANWKFVTSPDGKYIVGAGGVLNAQGERDCIAQVWDAATGKEVSTFTGHDRIIGSVAVFPDSRRAVTVANDVLCIWEVATGKELHRHKFSGAIRSLSLCPDGRQAVLDWTNTGVVLWDLENDKVVRTLVKGVALNFVKVTPDGRHVLYASDSQGKGPDGKLAFTDDSLVLLDLQTGKEVRRLAGPRAGVYSLAQSPDGRYAATTSTMDRTLRIWDLNPAAVPAPVKPPAASGERWRLDTPTGASGHLALSPDGKRLLIGLQSHALVVDTATGKITGKFAGKTPGAYQGLAFLPDGRRALILSNYRLVRLFDVDTGQLLWEQDHEGLRAEGFALSPDSRRYYMGGGADKTVRVFEVETGKDLLRLEGHKSPARTIWAAPDGRWVLSTSEQDFVWWDAQTGKQLGRGDSTGFVRGAAIAPDSRRFAIGTDRTIRIWDRETGKQIARISDLDSDAGQLAWLPDDRHLLAACGTTSSVNGQTVYRDTTVRLYEVASGRLIRKFEGHEKHMVDLVVTPDGRWGLSSNTDRTVHCWDLEAEMKEAPAK